MPLALPSPPFDCVESTVLGGLRGLRAQDVGG